jgi:hypothetical protein
MAPPGRGLTLGDHAAWDDLASSINLTDVAFIDPFGLVLAACTAAATARTGAAEPRRVGAPTGAALSQAAVGSAAAPAPGDSPIRSYRPPRDPAVAAYCARMGLVDILESDAKLAPAQAGSQRLDRTAVGGGDSADVLAEIRGVAGPVDGSSPVADLVHRRLVGPDPAPADVDLAEAAFCCVAEATDNVWEHAGRAGYAAAQVYRRGRPDERVVLAIGDPGRGLARSLRARHGPLGDVEAARLVVEEAVSGTRDRGTGIRSMLAIVDELDGAFVLRSGAATVRRSERRSSITGSSEITGTVVGIELFCRRRGR